MGCSLSFTGIEKHLMEKSGNLKNHGFDALHRSFDWN
jgi:hypothetical protein